MRKLTVRRKRTLAAFLMPVQLYVTDSLGWEVEINGEKCRKLGSIRSGQTKTFEITGQEAALYAVYGKADRNICFGRCALPCSDEDIAISGKSTLAPKRGNPFVFDEVRVQKTAEDCMSLEEKLKKFSAELARISPKKPRVSITPYRGKTTPFSSKFGGIPYLPKGMDYPLVREGRLAGKPLRFLAQLNFSEIPHIEGFPKQGILQFFAGCDGDDAYGMDFDDGTNQNGFRVIYHENVISDESQLASGTPAFEEDAYPFEGEFVLKFGKIEQEPVSVADHGFEKYAAAAYNKAFSTPLKQKDVKAVFANTARPCIDDDDHEFCEAMLESGYDSAECGCKTGGYPFFTQDDPRGAGKYDDCDTLLFQMDSTGSGADEILWGDSGVANFFISKEALARLDFSKVLYNWDCY